MKKLYLIIFLFFSTNSYSQTIELYFSGCDHSVNCKKCPPDYKETYQINVSKQVVLYYGVDLKTNETESKALTNCSVIDNKNFICGDKETFNRNDGALVTLDTRTIMKNGLLEDRPHVTIMDKNGKQFNPPTPRKLCRFKKNLIGQFESVN